MHQQLFKQSLQHMLNVASTQKDIALLADYYTRAFNGAIDILQGHSRALEYLFPDGDTSVAIALYDTLPVAQCMHQALSKALPALAKFKGNALHIAEVGAGTAATTQVIQSALQGQIASYLFTDVSDYFLKRARQQFGAYSGMHFGIYDLNADEDKQALEKGAYDLIIAVNCVHCAVDLKKALTKLRSRLADDGYLMLVEATRSDFQLMATTGLIEGFFAYDDFRNDLLRPILTVEEWKGILQETGFESISFYPDANMRDLGEHVFLARTQPDLSNASHENEWRTFLKERLPAHMVPTYFYDVVSLPLTMNAKVDRKTLQQQAIDLQQSQMTQYLVQHEPLSALESKLQEVFSNVAPSVSCRVDSNFFEAGLNSLQATEFGLALSQSFQIDVPITVVFEYPSIKSLMRYFTPENQGDDVIDEARMRARKRRARRVSK